VLDGVFQRGESILFQMGKGGREGVIAFLLTDRVCEKVSEEQFGFCDEEGRGMLEDGERR